MSAQTARSIASRVGVEEFGYHETAREVPCAVAQDVADNVVNAWPRWSSNSGVVGVGWIGYSRGPYMGRFDCTGNDLSNGGARESCHHDADNHAGAITVEIVILERSP